jgi:hypothetical protein
MNGQPVRDFTRLATAIIVAALVIGAGIAGSAYLRAPTTVTETSTTTSVTTSTTTEVVTTGPSQGCNEGVYNALTSLTLENVPVLLMEPNSTGLVCVTYRSEWQGNSSQYNSQYFVNDTYQFGLSISEKDCGTSGGGTGCSPNVSHSFVISASPSSIRPSPTTDYVSVVYTVTALSNSTGFYDRSAPYDYCIGMPMAVGYSASQVNASDFAPIVVPPCPLLPFVPVGVSVSGMNVEYIPFGA